MISLKNFYKFNEGNLMTNLATVLLVLTVILINFGAILTANIYSKSLEEHKLNRLFCRKSFSNSHCII